MWDCAHDELNNDGDPGEGKIPVKPIKLGVVN
jgi:hypothetical protein